MSQSLRSIAKRQQRKAFGAARMTRQIVSLSMDGEPLRPRLDFWIDRRGALRWTREVRDRSAPNATFSVTYSAARSS